MSDDIKREIVQNLLKYHSGKWVNTAVAIKALPPEAFGLIEELVDDGIIERKYVYHAGVALPLVRYVDNTWDRPTLTIMDGGKA